MIGQELVTAVQERIKLIVVLVQNHGFGSIGALSESRGIAALRHQLPVPRPCSGRLDGDVLPVDLAANAGSLGARVERVATIDELRACLVDAKSSTEPRPFVIHVEVDPLVPAPDGGAWWDVPVAAVSELAATVSARSGYEEAKTHQRPLV